MLSRRRSKQLLSLMTSFILAFTMMFPLGVAADQRVAILTPDSLMEYSLEHAELTVHLQGDQWSTESLSPDYITLHGEPAGMTVKDFVYGDLAAAFVILGYMGPPLEEDIPDLRFTISGDALVSGQDITTNPIKIFAVHDPDRFFVDSSDDTVDVNPGDGFCADANWNCTLRAAIMEANALPGEQTIQVPAGTFDLASSSLEITDDLRIIGSGMEETVINSAGWFRVMGIAEGVSVKLSDLKITGGMAGGNGADGYGGGIYNEGKLELDHVGIEDNAAYYLGGGIYSTGSLTTRHSKIADNGSYLDGQIIEKVDEGGGIYHTGNTLTIIDTEFQRNTSDSTGGAIYILDTPDAEILNSSFRENNTGSSGGALTVKGTDLSIEETSFIENSADSFGGGALIIESSNNGSSVVEINGSKFIGNTTAADGGALLVNFADKGGYTYVRSSEFLENHAAGSGGLLAFGQFVTDYHVTIEYSTIERNTAGSGDANITNDSLIQVDASYNYWGSDEDPKMTVGGDVFVAPWFTSDEMQRLGPSDALSYLEIVGGEMSPRFEYSHTTYVIAVDQDTDSIGLAAGVFDESSRIKVNGEEVEADVPREISVPVGQSQITIEVVSEDDDSREYVLYVMRKPGSQVFTVTSNADTIDIAPGDGICADEFGECTLRAAIIEANETEAHDVIILPAGEFSIRIEGTGEDHAYTGDLDILRPLSIEGAGAEQTTINGNGLDRVFDVQTSDFMITDVTITGGFATDGRGGAAIYTFGADYEPLEYCYLNYCDESPPEVDDYHYIIRDVVIEENTTDSEDMLDDDLGGAIENHGKLLLERVDIDSNFTVKDGGGLLNRGYAELIDSYVTYNWSLEDGAGILNTEFAYLVVRDTEISWNEADLDGGGIYNAGYAWILESQIHDNTAGRFAGVVSSSYTRISSSDISNNVADWLGGGAAVTDSGRLEIDGSAIAENVTLEGRGGAFAVADGGEKLFVQNSIIKSNQAAHGASLINVDDATYTNALIELYKNQILDHSGEQIIRNEVPDLTLYFSHNYWGPAGPYVDTEEWLTLYPYYMDEEMQFLAAPPDALSELVVTGGKLYPAFDPHKHEYMVLVDYDVESISITAHTSHPDARLMLFDEEEFPSGQPLEIEVDESLPQIVLSVAGPNDPDPTNFYGLSIFKEQLFIVDTFEDTVDVDLHDGVCADANGNCSLRAALMHATSNSIPAAISLPAGEYKLTLASEEELSDPMIEVGDLDVSVPVRILGAGSATAIIDATALEDRVFEVEGVPFHISGVTIRGGSTSGYGGAIFYNTCHQCGGDLGDDFASSSLADVIITGNSAGEGGAIMLRGSSLHLQDVEISHNTSESYGGGIYIGDGARLTAEQTRFTSNTADYGDGGAIFNMGELTIKGSSFEDNAAGMNGGGMYADGFTDILASTFRSNRAGELGGGLYLADETYVVNSTFAYNEAGLNGGGIFAAGPWFTLSYSTISGNVVSEPVGGQSPEAGGLATAAETTEIANSILYHNMVRLDGLGQFVDCAGSFYPLGVNIVGVGCQILEGEAQGDVLDVDPLLGNLADNGGKVMTMALLAGSPAIDGAIIIPNVYEDMAWVYNPDLDARQTARPQGTARDIGAYEFEFEGHSYLALYDSVRDELLIRFGSDLSADYTLNPGLFELIATTGDKSIQPGFESAHYGEDGRTIILKLAAHEQLEGSMMRVIMDTDAVRFVDSIYVIKSEADVLTQWQLQDALLKMFPGEIKSAKDIDIGIIVRALAEGSLADLFGDSYYDPAIVRFLLSLIETKYVSTV